MKYYSSRGELLLASQHSFKQNPGEFATVLFKGMQVYTPNMTSQALGGDAGKFLLRSLESDTWLKMPTDIKGKKFIDPDMLPGSLHGVDVRTQQSYQTIVNRNLDNPKVMRSLLAMYDTIHKEQISEILDYEETDPASIHLAHNRLGHVALFDDPSLSHTIGGEKYERVVRLHGVIRKQLGETAPKILPRSSDVPLPTPDVPLPTS
jgi:hypothetical protein